jgi:hypothetical protein
MFLLNGKSLPLDTPFKTEDGTSFPANWLRLTTLDEKHAIGITEVPDPVPEPIVVPEVVEEPALEPEPIVEEPVIEPAPESEVSGE